MTGQLLQIDAGGEANRIAAAIRDQVFQRLKRRGAVVGLSGGVDSAVAAALSARALGSDRVLGLLMPERESSADSLRLGQLVADRIGITTAVEDITAVLAAAGCYARRDEAIRSALPQYGAGYRSKLVLPGVLQGEQYRVSRIVIESPDGDRAEARLTADAYRTVVAASNFKQRVRKMMEYYHADRLQYAVIGTPNRAEYEQGFFVKNGDGAADLKPIAHLYKTQVYALARHLDVPDEIQLRAPTTDTFSLEQSQEEFYFSVPYEILDLCLYARNHGIPPEELGRAVPLTHEQLMLVFRDIDAKQRHAQYLHAPAQLIEPRSS